MYFLHLVGLANFTEDIIGGDDTLKTIENKIFNKYVPGVIFPRIGFASMIMQMNVMTERQKTLLATSLAVEEDYEAYRKRIEYLYTDNNWRKMHHKPMRRRLA